MDRLGLIETYPSGHYSHPPKYLVGLSLQKPLTLISKPLYLIVQREDRASGQLDSESSAMVKESHGLRAATLGVLVFRSMQGLGFKAWGCYGFRFLELRFVQGLGFEGRHGVKGLVDSAQES